MAGSGLLLGLLSAWRLWRRAAATPSVPDAWRDADVSAQLQQCISHLKDLHGQQARLQPAAYAHQVALFEQRAAALLAQQQPLGQLVTPPAPAPASAPTARRAPGGIAGFLQRRPQLRGMLWGGGTVAMLSLLYQAVLQEQTPRPSDPADAAPAPAVGMAPGAGLDDEARQELQTLMTALRSNPNDVARLVRVTHILLRAQWLREAAAVNARAQRLDPHRLETRVHTAVLQAAEGNPAAAAQALDEVVQEQAQYAEAWFFRGMLAMQAGQQQRMRESFEHFVQVAEPGAQRDRIALMLRNMH